MKDYYAILGLMPSAEDVVIKAAYKSLAQRYHPDRNPGDHSVVSKMAELNEAYQTLSDPEKRKLYDQQRDNNGSNGRQSSHAKNATSAETLQKQKRGSSWMLWAFLGVFSIYMFNVISPKQQKTTTPTESPSDVTTQSNSTNSSQINDKVTINFSDALSLVGSHPWVMATQPNSPFRNELKQATGEAYSKFVDGLSVSDSIKQNGNYIFGAGCAAHSCSIDMSAFAIDMRSGNLILMRLEGGKLAWVIGTENGLIPPDLCEAAKEDSMFVGFCDVNAVTAGGQ